MSLTNASNNIKKSSLYDDDKKKLSRIKYNSFDDLCRSDEELTPMVFNEHKEIKDDKENKDNKEIKDNKDNKDNKENTKINYEKMPIGDDKNIECDEDEDTTLYNNYTANIVKSNRKKNSSQYIMCECENGYCNGCDGCLLCDKLLCGICNKTLFRLLNKICGCRIKINTNIYITLILVFILSIITICIFTPVIYYLVTLKTIIISKVFKNRIRFPTSNSKIHLDENQKIDSWYVYDNNLKGPVLSWHKLKITTSPSINNCALKTNFDSPYLVDYYAFINKNNQLGNDNKYDFYTIYNAMPLKFMTDCDMYSTANTFIIKTIDKIYADKFVAKTLCYCNYYNNPENCENYSILNIMHKHEHIVYENNINYNPPMYNNKTMKNIEKKTFYDMFVPQVFTQILLYNNIIMDYNIISNNPNITLSQILNENNIDGFK